MSRGSREEERKWQRFSELEVKRFSERSLTQGAVTDLTLTFGGTFQDTAMIGYVNERARAETILRLLYSWMCNSEAYPRIVSGNTIQCLTLSDRIIGVLLRSFSLMKVRKKVIGN